ncbi:WhiB family transcriptional regulator [Streptomyces sp. NPDC015220]|uniref:WhiB family transcriptional regulator n=1 Tax=Streptomyces sp. NPDC015220 TaxID=3364947 RepID=UPI0036F84B8A
MTAGRYAWMTAALCAQTDPDLFTAGKRGGGSQTARCPVRPACEAHAAALEQHDGARIPGIWGGATSRQRRRARQTRDAT